VNYDFTFKATCNNGPPYLSVSKLYQSNCTEKKQHFAYRDSDEAEGHLEAVVSRGQACIHCLLIFFILRNVGINSVRRWAASARRLSYE
jgi:hypothetical protein